MDRLRNLLQNHRTASMSLGGIALGVTLLVGGRLINTLDEYPRILQDPYDKTPQAVSFGKDRGVSFAFCTTNRDDLEILDRGLRDTGVTIPGEHKWFCVTPPSSGIQATLVNTTSGYSLILGGTRDSRLEGIHNFGNDMMWQSHEIIPAENVHTNDVGTKGESETLDSPSKI